MTLWRNSHSFIGGGSGWELGREARADIITPGIPITTPSYWIDTELCTDEQLRHVFRSNTDEPFALLEERFECLREAGRVLCDVTLPLLSVFIGGY